MLPLLIAALLTVDGGVSETAPLTKRNWEHHPKIEAVRAVVAEVDAALSAKTLDLEKLQNCASEFGSYTVGRDAKHVVRSLVREEGGQDSVETHSLYFDAQGRLRFVFVMVGAVPGSWVQVRLWLAENGTVLWRTRTSGGEGPTHFATDERELLVKSPEAFLKQHTTCAKPR